MKTKKYYLLLFLLLYFIPVAQEQNIESKMLLAREQNAFLQRMNLGNVNANTLNYDLRYQRLDLTIDPAQYQVQGSVTSHFIPNQSLSSIYFDLTNELTVSQVSYRGNSLSFQQLASDELKIDFVTPISANVLDSITVHYQGMPAMGQDAVRTGTQPDGTPVFSTLSEPYGAQDWFPTKQSLNDKIEQLDLFITTPAQYSVAGNGILMSETILSNGQKLTKWRSTNPIAAYLVALGVTVYTKIHDTIGNPPFPFVNYVYPGTAQNTSTMSVINWTKDAMLLFEEYFGAYPFRDEKYGHMQFNYTGVAMEHQTMSSMPSWGYSVTAHELAHQWFGNKITCGTWNDIWLNEGFAVFGEHLVQEHLLMTPAQFQSYLVGQKNYITSVAGGSVYVSDANLTNVNAIFSGRLSYAKGGYVVRMMKWKLGDNEFFSAVRDYLNRPNLAYKYAQTADLKNSILASTQVDLTEFFNDWIYGQGYPTYTIRWKQAGNTLILRANQTRSHASVSFFEMPLPIRLKGANGEQLDVRPEHTSDGQYFYYQTPFPVTSVEFNYENQILERNSTVINDNSLSTQEIDMEIFSVYPIPAKNHVFVKGLKKTTSYTIWSMDGKRISSGQIFPEQAISITEFPPGKYLIKLFDGQTVPFMKE